MSNHIIPNAALVIIMNSDDNGERQKEIIAFLDRLAYRVNTVIIDLVGR